MPYSSVNYKLDYVDAIEGTTSNTVNVQESGEGGLNQLFWSNGVTLHKHLSVGLKATYLWGSIIREYSNTLTNTNEPIPYIPTVYARNYVKDFNFTAGISYHKDSIAGKKNYKINIGAVYDFQAKLNTEYYARLERRDAGSIIDSTTIINNEPGSITLPSSISVGISFAKADYWVIGTDFTYFDYRNFKDFSGETQPYGTQGWKLSLGSEFTPDPTQLGGYLKRMTYRAGVSYEKYPYLINSNVVNDFGVNLGLSLPVNRISSLDFAFKVGKRGDIQDNTIEENYFKIYFGMTFNDQWFIKRRFD
jgi:long-subunit fatty acid transport protein